MTEVEPENGDGIPSILDQNCLIVWWFFGHRASFWHSSALSASHELSLLLELSVIKIGKNHTENAAPRKSSSGRGNSNSNSRPLH
jgi:hypothetical protein